MSKNTLLLIQAGTPPDPIRRQEGDLPQWFLAALSSTGQDMDVTRVFEGEPLPAPGAHRAAIITGSWSMVTDRLDWSEATAQWIRDAMAIAMPIFGVCYGHQLMAHALGGKVGYHPQGVEIGCLPVSLHDKAVADPLVGALPPKFKANLTHRQTVLTPPDGAQVLARSAHDPHQIIRYGDHALSTQFHPEFTPAILAACIRRNAEGLREAGHDPAALCEALADTPHPRSLLARFVERYCTTATAAALASQ